MGKTNSDYKSALSALIASAYEFGPNPPIVPFATPEITEVCRNYSRAKGFDK